MSFKKLAIAAILAASALAATPASAAVYDFTFLTNDNVLDIANGTFTTNATNAIISASGTLTSTNAALLGGVHSLSFTLTGLGGGTADSEIWDNVYSTVTHSFSGAGIGLLLGNGHIATIYDVAGYAPCPGATCISVAPTSNSAYWDPGAAGRLVISAVPEPATWAMFLLGFGGIGFMLRGSRRQPAVAAA